MPTLMDALYCNDCEILMPCTCDNDITGDEPQPEDPMDLTHSAQCEVSTLDGTRCTCGIRTNKKED